VEAVLADPPADVVVLDEAERARLPGAIQTYRAALALVGGDPDATVEHADRAIATAAPGDDLTVSAAAALSGLAWWGRGDLEAAHRGYSVAVQGLERVGNISDVLYLAVYAGLASAAQVQIRDKSRPERQRAARGGTMTQGIAYAGLGVSFFVLVYYATGDGRSPVMVMTVSIFVLAILVMARQSVILRDDAQERQRRAVDLVEARFASLIRNASDVIMIVDADGCIEYASPAVQRTFGRSSSSLMCVGIFRISGDTRFSVQPNCDRSRASECTVRPYFRSPSIVTVMPSSASPRSGV